MHLYVLARGIKPHLDKWQNDLLAQWVKLWKGKQPLIENGQQVYIQLSVRPIQLYEIIFPEEELDNVLNIVGVGDYMFEQHSIIKRLVKYFRKIFGLEEVPKPKNPVSLMQPHQLFKSVDITPIGLKKDKRNAEDFETL